MYTRKHGSFNLGGISLYSLASNTSSQKSCQVPRVRQPNVFNARSLNEYARASEACRPDACYLSRAYTWNFQNLLTHHICSTSRQHEIKFTVGKLYDELLFMVQYLSVGASKIQFSFSCAFSLDKIWPIIVLYRAYIYISFPFYVYFSPTVVFNL